MVQCIDAALACSCSGVPTEENDDFDRRLEKLCRIRTAESNETKYWNEYMARALVDDEGSIVTFEFESCASTAIYYGTSDDSQTHNGSETAEGIEAVPVIIEPTQIVVHTIKREKTEEVKKMDEKVKTPLMKRLKSKFKEIIRKQNLNAENDKKQVSSITLSKLALRLKSKVHLHGLLGGGCVTMDQKSEMPIHSWRSMDNKGSEASLSGFEVSRIGSKHISIIDRSLFLADAVTPDAPSNLKLDKPPSLGNHVALKRATSNEISVHILGSSLLSDHLMMPSIDEGKECKEKRDLDHQNDDCSVSISPKPASFVDVLDEEGSRSTISSCTGADLGSTYEQKTNCVSPEQDFVIEEPTSNGDSSYFEIMYKIRAPYEMSRNTENPEC